MPADILKILEEEYGNTKSALHYSSVFELLIAVILSAQTNDNQVNKITDVLFQKYNQPEDFAKMPIAELEQYIKTCGLYKNKAKNRVAAAQKLVQDYHSQVPNTKEELLTLPGVGNKTANVVLSVGFGVPALAVDTHVFRVSHRLGLASGNTPDKVEEELCAIIPQEKWSDAHHWLIWHGRRVCAARNPKCITCKLRDFCPGREDME